MNANEEIFDANVRHAVYLQRYGSATVRKIIALLDRVDQRVAARLAKEDLTEISRLRLERLLEGIREINQQAHAAVRKELRSELRELAAYEAGFQAEVIRKAVPVAVDVTIPAAAQLYGAVTARPFEGRLLKDWFADLEGNAFRRLRNAIRMGVVEGRTTDQMIREVRGTRANGYRDGILAINRRGAEATVRTAVNHTASTARGRLYEENADLIKGVRWVSTLDGRTSAVCRGRDGMVYPLDKGPRPPGHINCLPGDSPVLAGGRITGASKRWLEGEIDRVRTRDGRELRATPNHPVLMDRGWIGAGFLDRGDKLLCLGRPEQASAHIDTGDHDVEASIKEKADAFLARGDVLSIPVPTAAPDFHGDGAGSEVAVVGTDGGLRRQIQAAPLHERLNLALEAGHAFLRALERLCALHFLAHALASSARGVMGGGGEDLDLARRGAIHSGLLLLGSVAKPYPIFAEYPLDGTWADAEFLRDPANAKAFAVATDDVLGVERRDFRGHVYDLETEKKPIFQKVSSHNCRSMTTPILKSWNELGIKLGEAPAGARASMDGQVPGDLSYNDWLRRQPAGFQDDVLGPTRGKLYRKGGLTLDRFIDASGEKKRLTRE